VYTSDTCPPGFIFTECSAVNNVDASCDQQCNDEDHGKPDDLDETSEWVWTKRVTIPSAAEGEAASTTLVHNLDMANGDSTPNMGCMWRCKDGYVLSIVGDGLPLPSGQTLPLLEPGSVVASAVEGNVFFCVRSMV
jgi:hypothetical protein